MAKPEFAQGLMRPVIERAQLSREEWLEALVRVIGADVRKMFGSYGSPLPNRLPPLDRTRRPRSQRSKFVEPWLKVVTFHSCGGMLRIRIVDKFKALELHGKAMGYFDEPRLEGLTAIVLPSITVEFVKPQASYLGVPLSRSS